MISFTVLFGINFTIFEVLLLKISSISARNISTASDLVRHQLTIGGFFLLSNDLPAENICLEAAKMAVRDINANGKILENYNLSLNWANTECSEPIVVNELLKMITIQHSQIESNDCHQTPAIAVMGPLCGVECEVTGPIVKMWDSIQVSYGCGAAPKEKRLKNIDNPYSNFFRLEPSLSSQYNGARLAFLNKFGWQRVFMLYHSGRSGIGFLEDQQELFRFLTTKNISVPLSELWLYSAADNLDRMLREDARVIFLGFSQAYLPHVLKAGCEAYQRGMKGPKYVWITVAYFAPYWWRYGQVNETGCTMKQLDEVFEGMFYVGEDSSANPNRTTPVGRSLKSAEDEIHDELIRNVGTANIGTSAMTYIPACYDNVVILALALNKTEEQLIARQSTVRLYNFYENRRIVSDLMLQNLHQLDYSGFKGHYKFDKTTNDPIYDFITIYRDFGGVRKAVFWFDQTTNLSVFNPNDITWLTRNGQAPLDRTTIITVSIEITVGLQIAVTSLCALSVLSALIYVIAVLQQQVEEVRRMSPKLVLIMLIGCISIYLHLSLTTNDPVLLPSLCQARLFLLLLGCCLLFGGLFIKVFRVFLIFTRLKQHYFLDDWKLIFTVLAWTAVNLAMLFIWFGVGSFKAGVVTRYVQNDDVIIKQITLRCMQNYTNEFLYLFCSLQGALLLFGIFVSFFTRNVTVALLHNDSKQIALCVYITALSTVLALVLAYAVEDVNISYGLMSTVVLTATLCIQWVIVYSLNNNVAGLLKCSRPVVSPTFFVNSGTNIARMNCISHTDIHPIENGHSPGNLDVENVNTPVAPTAITCLSKRSLHRRRLIRQMSCPYVLLNNTQEETTNT